MVTLTIRNIDDDIMRRLTDRAKANHRSLEEEVLSILTRHFDRRFPLVEFRRRTDQLMSTASKAVQTDSVDLIREDRER